MMLTWSVFENNKLFRLKPSKKFLLDENYWQKRSVMVSCMLDSKVVPIIKCTCTVLLITSEIFQILTLLYRYQFVGEVMTDM